MMNLFKNNRVVWGFLATITLSLSLISCKSDQRLAQTSIFNYTLKTVMEVEGRQGVATDGQVYAISGSKSLYKYSLQGELLASNLKPFAELSGGVNHLGDIAVYGDEIFAGVENFVDGRGENIQIVIYDLNTLQFKRSIPWEPASGQVEVCGIAVDGFRQSIWLADWLNGQYLYRYDLESGKYKGRLELTPIPKQIQGILVYKDQILLTADDGDADSEQPDHIYSVAIPDINKLVSGKLVAEKTLSEFIRAGEVEGLCLSPEGDLLTVLMNRGTRIVLGMPKGFYPGYDREIHELYTYNIK